MIFLPHTNTVILLEPYCGTMTEPGLPVADKNKEAKAMFTLNRMDLQQHQNHTG